MYARNACFEIAKSLGVRYFIQLDDDYTTFQYRFGDDLRYRYGAIKSLDRLLDLLLDYYESIPAKSIAIAQGGDFIGGGEATLAKAPKLLRKCINTFICSTERPFKFIGRVNEDVNTYARLGSVGELFLTVTNVSITQVTTQSNTGGMTEMYLDSGTYVKSFYTVMYHPSSVKVGVMGAKHRRLHHRINWRNTVPVILDESYKKRPRKGRAKKEAKEAVGKV